MTQSLTIIIIDKGASLKTLTVKDYKVEDLYKKCGFKKADGFNLQVEWPVKLDGQRYLIQMYGKLDGKIGFALRKSMNAKPIGSRSFDLAHQPYCGSQTPPIYAQRMVLHTYRLQ